MSCQSTNREKNDRRAHSLEQRVVAGAAEKPQKRREIDKRWPVITLPLLLPPSVAAFFMITIGPAFFTHLLLLRSLHKKPRLHYRVLPSTGVFLSTQANENPHSFWYIPTRQTSAPLLTAQPCSRLLWTIRPSHFFLNYTQGFSEG